MFSPTLSTMTGAAVNRIEAWADSSVTPRFGRRLMPTVIGLVGVVAVGSVECLVSGAQFVLYFAAAVVKQTLQIFRLRSLADRLPDWRLHDFKILAHKTLALAMQATAGVGVILWRPEKLVILHDFLGLERYRKSDIQKTKEVWAHRLGEIKRHPIALTSISVLAMVCIARWVFSSPPSPAPSTPISTPTPLVPPSAPTPEPLSADQTVDFADRVTANCDVNQHPESAWIQPEPVKVEKGICLVPQITLADLMVNYVPPPAAPPVQVPVQVPAVVPVLPPPRVRKPLQPRPDAPREAFFMTLIPLVTQEILRTVRRRCAKL